MELTDVATNNQSGDSAVAPVLPPFIFWQLAPQLNGTALGVCWLLLTIVTLVVNLFICVYTIVQACQRKNSLQREAFTTQSSLLLFNMALASVVEAFSLPFVLVALFSGEWLVNQPLEAKIGTCILQGLMGVPPITILHYILAIMSVERYLFIRKPLVHKRLTNKVNKIHINMNEIHINMNKIHTVLFI